MPNFCLRYLCALMTAGAAIGFVYLYPRAAAQSLTGFDTPANILLAPHTADEQVIGSGGGILHAPLILKRDPAGRPIYGPLNFLISTNWSGYAICGNPNSPSPCPATGNSYTSAQATWVVPSVSYAISLFTQETPRHGSASAELTLAI